MKKVIGLLLVLGLFVFCMSSVSMAAGNWWNAMNCTINGVQKCDVETKVGLTWDGLTGTAWYALESDLSYEKELLAEILSAQAQGLEVNVKFNAGKINGVRVLSN